MKKRGIVGRDIFTIAIAKEHRRVQHAETECWTCICDSCIKVKALLWETEQDNYFQTLIPPSHPLDTKG